MHSFRVTNDDSLSNISQYDPCFVYVCLNCFQMNLLFMFALSAAGVVPCICGSDKTLSYSMTQIIFYFWSFEIPGNIRLQFRLQLAS